MLPEGVVMKKLETVSMVVCLDGLAGHAKMNAVNTAMRLNAIDTMELVHLDVLKVI